MSISIETAELIKRYVKNDLTEEERLTVEQLLDKHPELHEEVTFAKALIKEAEEVERQNILDTIQKVVAQSESQTSSSANQNNHKEHRTITLNKWFLTAAASAAIFIALAWWYFSFINGNDLDTFRQQAYTTYIISDHPSRGDATAPLIKAESALNRTDYEGSLALLEQITETDSLYVYSIFLTGHNYYYIGEYELAIQNFDRFLATRASLPEYDQPIIENAEWSKILALLAHLEHDNTDENKSALKESLNEYLQNSNKNSTYYDHALRLQKLLKN